MRLYLSYRRTDLLLVSRLASQLTALGQDVWWDRMLLPGVAFEQQFRDNMQKADVFVAFISNSSTSGIQQPQEIAIAQSLGTPIVVVKLDDVTPARMPNLAAYPWTDVAGRPDADAARLIEAACLALLAQASPRPLQPAGPADGGAVANLADGVREELQTTSHSSPERRAIFVVHGHDDAMMADVSDFLRSESLEPVVLKKLKTRDNTLFEKFRAVSGQAKFAVVLISADDLGASVLDYHEDGAADRALMYRARQNVILELGFFFGQLGWDNVFVLKKDPPKRVPKFERPSDLDGVLFESYDATGEWKDFLRNQLKARRLL